MQGPQNRRKAAVVSLITTARLGEGSLTQRFGSRAGGGRQWAGVTRYRKCGRAELVSLWGQNVQADMAPAGADRAPCRCRGSRGPSVPLPASLGLPNMCLC